MVPHLTTSLSGPLAELERIILGERPEIERWLRTMRASAVEVGELVQRDGALEARAANA
jgi:hypothetical protein